MFVDQVTVTIKAGRGGNGCVSFRREARVPKGGPDGGHGGDGGNVYLVSDSGLNSLAYYRFHPMNKAKNGAPGEGSNRTGKRGADLTLRVPVGTAVRERDAEKVIFDFIEPGQVFLAARGGKGGRGNASYATSTHQAPREHEPGRPGEDRELVLELKLIADVGLVGFPNAGTSTLISRISAARPVIAAYPFTTLVPNLGVVDLGEFRSFVVADIPGLIEGAHAGHGLGIRFLKHIERTRLLVHLVDVSPESGRDPVRDFEVVQSELATFRPPLDNRPQIMAANKIDLLAGDTERLDALRKLARSRQIPFFPISALRTDGLKALLRAVARKLESLRREAGEDPA